ncbi:ABC transporter permease [Pilibacter termitis]|uniref:ABC transporter permease n=1 Tax=Pilibacter termitis TaxID=263852 RepID=UPI001F207CCD|nr:FtsX-like permease family protein [Pilibacter termitis]
MTNQALKLLRNKGNNRLSGTYETFDMSALTDGIGNVLSMLTYFISAIAGISLLIAGVGVMNMMYISVAERTKEIGIRRALGAKRRDIRLQFLLEGVFLTVIGGIIGYIFGFLVALTISVFLPFQVAPDFFTLSLALGVSGFIGILFSVIPANKAANKDLIEILR